LPVLKARRALAEVKRLNVSARLVVSIQEEGSGPTLIAEGAHAAIDAEEEAGREMVRLMLAGSEKAAKSLEG
jgi:hypothetical protein